MESNNSNTLRAALASAIGTHVKSMGVTAKDAAAAIGMQYSRLSQIIRGDVKNVSSDAMVNILGSFGYRMTGINGSGNGTEIVLSLDKAEGQVLPEIEEPVNPVEAARPFIEEYADANGLKVDEDSINAASEYVESYSDHDANRLVADETTQKFESGELGQSDEHVRVADASFHVMANEFGFISGVGQNGVAVLDNE